MRAEDEGAGLMRRVVAVAVLIASVGAAIGWGSIGIAGAQDSAAQEELTPARPSETPAKPPREAPDGDIQPQVTGGATADATNYPWMAALLLHGTNDPYEAQFCGGVLISPLHVLTLGRCTIGKPANTIDVVLGKTFLSTMGGTGSPDRRTVATVTLHPDQCCTPGGFDFAVLTLTSPANGVPTAAYTTDQSREQPGQQGIFLGWGQDENDDFPDGLKGWTTNNLTAPSTTACGTWSTTPGTGAAFHNEHDLCVGQTLSGGHPATCALDDGGPFAVGNAGGWVVVGINRTGPEDCGVGRPDLYARVSSVVPWLDSIVGLPSDEGTYHPILPYRLLDTRTNEGKLAAGYVCPQCTINATVGGANNGTIPPIGATAVVMNVAVTQPSSVGWLTIFPTGGPLPTAANLNFVPGQTVPNLVTVQIGQGGKVSINNTGGGVGFAGFVHVVIDVVGWYGPDDTGGFYNALAPRRILDTRLGTHDNPTLTQPVSSGTSSSITVKVCGDDTGVPNDASAVVVNASAVAGSTPGWMALWPGGFLPGSPSNLNYSAGQAIANLVIVQVAGGGACTVQLANSPGVTPGANAPIHAILDLVGWFGPLGDPTGGRFHAMPPDRIVDTRTGDPSNPTLNTAVGPEATIDPLVEHTGTNVPDTAIAVIVNVVATGPTAYGWLTAFPDLPLPEASNLLFLAGQTVPNLSIVQVGTDHRIRITNSKSPSAPNPGAGTVHVVIDESGWFE